MVYLQVWIIAGNTSGFHTRNHVFRIDPPTSSFIHIPTRCLPFLCPSIKKVTNRHMICCHMIRPAPRGCRCLPGGQRRSSDHPRAQPRGGQAVRNSVLWIWMCSGGWNSSEDSLQRVKKCLDGHFIVVFASLALLLKIWSSRPTP